MKLRGAMRDLQREYAARGWTVTVRNNSHLRWQYTSGATVFTSFTPSDHQAIRNIRRDLNRYERQATERHRTP